MALVSNREEGPRDNLSRGESASRVLDGEIERLAFSNYSDEKVAGVRIFVRIFVRRKSGR